MGTMVKIAQMPAHIPISESSADINVTAQCNPGYFGFNCTEMCPFPVYGIRCERRCKCSVEDCSPATGCSIPNSKSNDTKFLIDKNDEFTQKRFYLVVVAYVFGGVLMVLVLTFIWIELSHRKRRTNNEHKIATENVPAYHEIIMSEDGGIFISENEHISNETTAAGL
ncbi:platelet endothelial aggregation receptor 1-like [Saccostrea echinata]|uniref:platelet endothelial aggregation receptor 1-like n=1 Tax=Saccostrea echinata TaxID=191078 RepID=UPI002A800E05|nr:platelet endothelial aggregation receptor 1-like [Saccostrea echinata]